MRHRHQEGRHRIRPEPGFGPGPLSHLQPPLARQRRARTERQSSTTRWPSPSSTKHGPSGIFSCLPPVATYVTGPTIRALCVVRDMPEWWRSSARCSVRQRTQRVNASSQPTRHAPGDASRRAASARGRSVRRELWTVRARSNGCARSSTARYRTDPPASRMQARHRETLLNRRRRRS